jgi:methionine sulfoxide reductase heme-binding subunit
VVLTLKILLWLGALAPAAWLAAGFFLDWLGVNPIEKMTHVTGMTALILLLLTLAVTPLRRLTGWNPLIRLRRPLGLFAFFNAFLHFSIWMVLDLGFQLAWVWEEIRERPFITVGFAAFLVMIPLAITSTKGWIRRLGRRWALLHRGAYLAAGLALVHFTWIQKADLRLPLLLAGVLALLLAFRIPLWLAGGRGRSRKRLAEGPEMG